MSYYEWHTGHVALTVLLNLSQHPFQTETKKLTVCVCVCSLPDDFYLDVRLDGDGCGGGGEGEVLRGDESPAAKAHHQPRVVHQDQVQLHRPHPERSQSTQC